MHDNDPTDAPDPEKVEPARADETPSEAQLAADALRAEFLQHVEARSVAGGLEHGERSFDLRGDLLVDEITEELADIAAWAIPVYGRVRRLGALLGQVESASEFLQELQRRTRVALEHDTQPMLAQLAEWILDQLEQLEGAPR